MITTKDNFINNQACGPSYRVTALVNNTCEHCEQLYYSFKLALKNNPKLGLMVPAYDPSY